MSLTLPRWLRRSLWLVALGAGPLLYLLGCMQGRSAGADAAVIAQAKAVLAASQPYHAQLAAQLAARQAAIARAATAESSATHAREAAGRAIALADSIRTVRAPVTDSALAALPGWAAALITSLKLENGALRSALDDLDASLARADVARANLLEALRTDSLALAGAQVRIATLETSLRAVVKIDECRILFLKCPSRMASLLIGAGTAIAAHFVLKAP